jgi:TnpA family transposase
MNSRVESFLLPSSKLIIKKINVNRTVRHTIKSIVEFIRLYTGSKMFRHIINEDVINRVKA